MSSMINHFKDLLTEGEAPSDPFEIAAKEAAKALTKEQKEAARLAWNNRIMNHCYKVDKMQSRMLARRARRAYHRH